MAQQYTLTVTPGSGATINTLPPTGQAVSAQSLPVVVASDQSAIPVLGERPWEAALTIVRPANVTPYAAGQLVSTATTGLVVLPALQTGFPNQRLVVRNVDIISSYGAAATKGIFALTLFGSSNPPGAGFNDGAAFNPTAAALSALGVDVLGTVGTLLTGIGTAAYGYALTADQRQVLTDPGGYLYVALVLTNAYTPASGENISVRLSGVY